MNDVRHRTLAWLATSQVCGRLLASCFGVLAGAAAGHLGRATATLHLPTAQEEPA